MKDIDRVGFSVLYNLIIAVFAGLNEEKKKWDETTQSFVQPDSVELSCLKLILQWHSGKLI